MQGASQLLASLRRRGVSLRTDNGQLHFGAPKGVLSTDDLNDLRTHKRDLVELLEQADLREFRVRSVRSTKPLPLTALQMRKWKYAYAHHGGRRERTCVNVHRVVGRLNAEALARSLQTVAQRHDAMRIRFVLSGGIPMQQVEPELTHDLQVLDLQDSSLTNTHEQVVRLCNQFVQEKVDLLAGPLWAAKLLRFSPDHHVLIVPIDHMISDLISREIVADEIWTLYRQTAQGLTPLLPTPALQFSDYVAWQQRTRGAWMTLHGPYWHRRLKDIPRSRVAHYDELEPPVCAARPIDFDEALTTKLRILARQACSPLVLTVLTIWVAAISRWLDQRDFMLAFITSGRDRPELQKLVGFLADYVHLRMQVGEEESFVDLLERVAVEFRSACDHLDYGRAPDLLAAGPPLECGAEVIFNWIPNTSSEEAANPMDRETADTCEVTTLQVPLALAMPVPMKLAAAFQENATQIVGGLTYRPDIFESHEVEQFVQALMSFAERVAERPHDRCVSIGHRWTSSSP